MSASVVLAVMACAAMGTIKSVAQEERPQIIPGERKASQKKDAGPRALAVLQLSANGKASLVPIAILIDKKFWDATAYKANPVPMALEPGTVYEGERAGNSVGLFTVGSALHSNAVNSQTPWLGTGLWQPVGSEPATKVAKADTTPRGMDSTDEPPRLSRGGSEKGSSPANGSSGSAPASSSTPPAGASKPSGSSDGDEPPRLNRPASSSPETAPNSPAGSNPPASTTSPSSDAAKTATAKPDAKANIPTSDSGANEANRPILRRGKPVESFADEEVPGYSKPGAAPSSASTAAGKIQDTTPAKSDVQLIPAISDAGGPMPRSFTFEWVKGDEEDRRKQMVAMAKQQVQAYVVARAKAQISAKPALPTTRKRVLKTPEPILENVQMVAYDLWNSNQPVIIFSAEAHMPPPPAGTPHSEFDTDMQYSIRLVTYPDIYNNLHTLYSGVTDKFHLDVTPRLDFVDVVDADGDGRGELLFRETSDAGAGWIIYRATGDKLWKLFDSQRPE